MYTYVITGATMKVYFELKKKIQFSVNYFNIWENLRQHVYEIGCKIII